MKKTLFFIILLLFATGCTTPESELTLKEFIDTIEIASEITDDISLPETYELNGETVIAIWTSSEEAVLSGAGVVNQAIEDTNIILNLSLSTAKETEERNFQIFVPGYGLDAFLTDALNTLVMPETTKTNINLPATLSYLGHRLELSWNTDNASALSASGRVTVQENNVTVSLTVMTIYEQMEKTRDFEVIVLGLTPEEKINLVFDEASPQAFISSNITLPTVFDFSLTGSWSSSHPDVLSNDGVINPTLSGQYTVTLTLTLSSNDWRTYEVIVSKFNHMIIDRTFPGSKTDLELNAGALVLSGDALIGEYNTGILNTLSFSSAVASWAATSSTTATVELQIQVLVGSTWSRYFSYGVWGKGLQNKCYDASDAIASLNDDEIIIAASQKASAIRMKATLRRTSTTDASPRLRLLACALNIPGYTYPVDISTLPQQVDYDVPKLYQHAVPTIGGVICSATSSTMLLKYKGHDFSSIDSFEHRYIAEIVREYNSGIYGNWVYNTVGMSSFDEVSYVKRMYSYQELIHHLATVGPIAASVKGTLVGELVKTWTTSGHLIVIRGYRWEGSQLYILANDPNLSSVYEEYKVENFMSFWRNVAYIIE